MKRFQIGLSSVVFVLAVVTSFAFRTAEAKNRAMYTCTWYDFTGNVGEEFDPTKYVLASGTPSCPGQGAALCAVCVDPGEVYTSGTYAGLPKVDDVTSAIFNVVNFALMTEEDNAQEDVNTIAEVKAP